MEGDNTQQLNKPDDHRASVIKTTSLCEINAQYFEFSSPINGMFFLRFGIWLNGLVAFVSQPHHCFGINAFSNQILGNSLCSSLC
jgi:hypothetical protein